MFSLETNLIHRAKMIVVMIALFVLSMPIFAPIQYSDATEIAFKGQNYNNAESSGESEKASSEESEEETPPDADDNFGYIWGGA